MPPIPFVYLAIILKDQNTIINSKIFLKTAMFVRINAHRISTPIVEIIFVFVMQSFRFVYLKKAFTGNTPSTCPENNSNTTDGNQ